MKASIYTFKILAGRYGDLPFLWCQDKNHKVSSLLFKPATYNSEGTASQAFPCPLLLVVQLLSHVQLFATSWTAACPVLHHLLELAQTHVH